jgi:hypothetical protein
LDLMELFVMNWPAWPGPRLRDGTDAATTAMQLPFDSRLRLR